MMMKGKYILAFALVIALAACQMAQQQPERLGMKGQEPRNLVEKYVHQVINDLRDSFVSRDTAGFMKHVSSGYYGGKAQLEKNLRKTFLTFEERDVSLTIAIGEIETDEQRITVPVTWRLVSKETSASSAQGRRERALSSFTRPTR